MARSGLCLAFPAASSATVFGTTRTPFGPISRVSRRGSPLARTAVSGRSTAPAEHRYQNGAWTTIAGGASDISVGADGVVYVVSNAAPGPFGSGIYRYANGIWTQLPGAAVRIAASWDSGSYSSNVIPGGFWIVNAQQSIFYWNPIAGYTQVPGAASALAPTTNGGLFALGVPNTANGNPIYYDDLSTGTWAQQPGAGIAIATNSSNVYVIGAAGGIYQAPITVAVPSPSPSPSATPSPSPTPSPTATPTLSPLVFNPPMS